MTTMSAIDDVFAANLRQEMDRRGLTITEVAHAAHMHRPNLSRILSGVESCSLERAERIAEALGVKLPKLLVKKSEQSALT